MLLCVGLGNPGQQYLMTRHNIGFAAVARLANVHYKKDSDGPIWKFDRTLDADWYACGPALLVQPRTFVNESGKAVARLAGAKGIAPQDFLLVCDDVNLEFGKMRLRPSGSAGGHHGLESVIRETGTEEFSRLRIGVGRTDMPQDLAGFVLKKFDDAEMKRIDEGLLDHAASVCREWIEKGFEAATVRLSVLQGKGLT